MKTSFNSNTKELIRRKKLSQRKTLDVKTVHEKSKKVFQNLKKVLQKQKPYNTIMFYYPINNEVDTSIMFSYFWDQKKTIYLPTLKNDQIIPAIFNKDTELIIGPYKIPEPKKKITPSQPIEIIIVPGVAFDKKNNRIGYGKGYYDRFLNESFYTIGLAFSEQIVNKIEKNEKDMQLNQIVTDIYIS